MWKMLSDPKKRAVLGFIGMGFAAVAGGGWAVFTYVWPKEGHAAPAVVNCAGQGVAVVGNVSGSTINADEAGSSLTGSCAK